MLIVGASGVGKSELARVLTRIDDFPCRLIASYTTRAPRNRPVLDDRFSSHVMSLEGPDDYRFVSDREFDRLEADGKLAERAEIYGRRYGVGQADIEALGAGEVGILAVDPDGAAELKRIHPRSLIVRVERDENDRAAALAARGPGLTETAEGRRRLDRDEQAPRANAAADYVVYNGPDPASLVEAARKLATTMRKHIAYVAEPDRETRRDSLRAEIDELPPANLTERLRVRREIARRVRPGRTAGRGVSHHQAL